MVRHLFQQSHRGYIALLSVTVIMAAVIVTGVMITLVSANGLIGTFTSDQGLRAAALADSCAYEALWQIERFGTSYLGSHTVEYDADQTCTVTVTAGTGTQLDVAVTAEWRDQYTRTAALVVETSPFALVDWQEGQ